MVLRWLLKLHRRRRVRRVLAPGAGSAALARRAAGRPQRRSNTVTEVRRGGLLTHRDSNTSCIIQAQHGASQLVPASWCQRRRGGAARRRRRCKCVDDDDSTADGPPPPAPAAAATARTAHSRARSALAPKLHARTSASLRCRCRILALRLSYITPAPPFRVFRGGSSALASVILLRLK